MLPLLAAWLIAKAGPYVLQGSTAIGRASWPRRAVVRAGRWPRSGNRVGQEYPHSHLYFTLFQAGEVPHVDFALRGDSLTLIMLMMVTFIGTLIAIFAVGYMHG